MKKWVYFLVILFIILETALFGKFPFYAIALSFTGYLVYKLEIKSFYAGMGIALILGASSARIHEVIIFFAVYILILDRFYKIFAFQQVNIFIISAIEVTLYLLFIYLFRQSGMEFMTMVKEFLFVLFYNFIFYYFDKIKTQSE